MADGPLTLMGVWMVGQVWASVSSCGAYQARPRSYIGLLHTEDLQMGYTAAKREVAGSNDTTNANPVEWQYSMEKLLFGIEMNSIKGTSTLAD